MKEENSAKSQFASIEEAMLATWEKEGTFEQSLKNREGRERFSFNDGPPFANGLPHFGHSLVTAIKDSMLRYKTMRGYYVLRRNGWDCHGLPVEFDVEKQLGISGKKQIEELGVEKFNAACRDSIFRYKAEWEAFLKRFGRWSDYDNYYATVDTNYTESVWWTLSEIHKKDLLYRGLKSVPYCPRCETPLSNFELNEGYRDNVPDPSVYVLFPLVEDSTAQQVHGLDAAQGSSEARSEVYKEVQRTNTAADDAAPRRENQQAGGSAAGQGGSAVYLLAWTTTPWTLPGNAALAVDPDADYAYIELKSGSTTLILAKERLEALKDTLDDYSLLKSVKGSELANKAYEPLYPLPSGKFNPGQTAKAHRVYADDNVSLEDGTGILHVAPRYGETDLSLGLKENLPLIESVDSSGHLIYGPAEALGKFFKEADEPIIADLTRKNRIFNAEIAEHTYPFCWRCDTPLMYFATNTWFIEVTKVKDQMLKTAEEINWTPAHIKTGRFGKWLEGARDWAISRNRYWGAPLPIWVNTEDEDDYIVVPSIAELEELVGQRLDLPKVEGTDSPDLHRPFIDQISFQKDGKSYKRVEEVLDCWFESGSMPLAQWHYPFENKEAFEQSFPADFVTEGLDQTRLWFYVQHVISTILFDRPAYQNVIVNGIILAADGEKLSKRLRNYPPIEEVFDKEGVDSLRLYLLSSPQATETAGYPRFKREAVTDIQRNVLATLLNSFKFFQTYSAIDQWRPQNLERPTSANILDQWILARLVETGVAATRSADAFKIAHAIEPVANFVDDLSNWYIRRSRRRFWKSQNDSDKNTAYATLHYCLMRTSQMLAPWSPFISDYLWRQLVAGTGQPESVHLSEWLSVKEPDSTSTKMLEEMEMARQVITEGLAQRAESKIKVRQPLAAAVIGGQSGLSEELQQIVAEELNVKKVEVAASDQLVKVDTQLTPELKGEGIARDLIRLIQNARKKADFKVEDRIKLRIQSSSSDITEVVETFKELIFAETLAQEELESVHQAEYSEKTSIDEQDITISLSRV